MALLAAVSVSAALMVVGNRNADIETPDAISAAIPALDGRPTRADGPATQSVGDEEEPTSGDAGPGISEHYFLKDGHLSSARLREVARFRFEELLASMRSDPDGQAVRQYLYPKLLDASNDFGGRILLEAFECGQVACVASLRGVEEATLDGFIVHAFLNEERFVEELHATDVFTNRGHVRRVFFVVRLDAF